VTLFVLQPDALTLGDTPSLLCDGHVIAPGEPEYRITEKFGESWQMLSSELVILAKRILIGVTNFPTTCRLIRVFKQQSGHRKIQSFGLNYSPR
jgi:hypothetical protein